jgi:hypothetical protein
MRKLGLVVVSVVVLLAAPGCRHRYLVPDTVEGRECSTQCRGAFESCRGKPDRCEDIFNRCTRTCPGAVPE